MGEKKDSMLKLTTEQIKKKRMGYLVIATAALLFLGLVYAFSMFAAPMGSAFELEKSAVALTFNIMMISFCIGAVGGAQLDKMVGIRKALIMCAVLVFFGFAGTGLFGNGNIFILYLCYGVFGGFGVGIGYNCIVSTTNLWFPDKVGFSSGVLMMGFGLGSLILGTLSVNLATVIGIDTVLMMIGIVAGSVVVALSFILRRPPVDIVDCLVPEKVTSAGYDPGDEDAVLKTPTFYVYWIWAIIVYAIGLATIGNCASDAQAVGLDAGFATLLVGLVSTCNGIARVIIGLIYDKTNVKATMLVDGFVASFACLCIVGAFVTGIPALYVVGALSCGFCYGGVPVVASAFTRQRFGAKSYPLNLSLANFSIMFASILNIVIQGTVGASGSRLAVFIVLGVLSVVALLDVKPFSMLWNRDIKMLDERRCRAGAGSEQI